MVPAPPSPVSTAGRRQQRRVFPLDGGKHVDARAGRNFAARFTGRERKHDSEGNQKQQVDPGKQLQGRHCASVGKGDHAFHRRIVSHKKRRNG
jgi:hypothetical protein